MRVSENMACGTERELSSGMEIFIRENTKTAKEMAREFTNGLMELYTRENGKTTKRMARGSKST